MWWKNFLLDEDGTVTLEYLLLAGCVVILMAIGVSLLYSAMRDYFTAWAGFFNSAGGTGTGTGT